MISVVIYCINNVYLYRQDTSVNIHSHYLFHDLYSFTLYPANNRIGRGNLVLRHSVPHFLSFPSAFPLNFSRNCVLSGLNAGLLSCCQREKVKILINNNTFLRMGIEPTIVALQSHPCTTALR